MDFSETEAKQATPTFTTEMSVASDQPDVFEKASVCEPRSRRMGISGPPSSYRLSTSTTGTSESAPWTTPPSSPLLTSSSPPRPPRSPLRPTGPEQRVSSLLQPDIADIDDVMPLSHSRSLGSLSGMLNSQPASLRSGLSGRSQTPDKPLPITPDPSTSSATLDDDHDRVHEPTPEPNDSVFASDSGSSSLLKPPTAVTKRVRALEELLSSERAYASDLAIIRDIHIPLASGQPAPFPAAPATPPSSGSSVRTQSTSSDSLPGASSSTSSPPMTRDDIRIIFNNVAELAVFSDSFTEQIEEALGSVLEGGSGEDHVGALFLETISTMEPLYLAYITKHPIALEHLNGLPQTPALTAYLAESRTLASRLTHAWDLPSLLIKPVQRLLKYPLLLGAIIEETPDVHSDKANLKRAREKMEEVARGVNEGRRRREVIKEVLNNAASSGTPSKRHSDPKPKPKKKGLNIGVSASVSLGRMKSFSMKPGKAKEGAEANQEAEQVVRLGEKVRKCEAFARTFAKETVEWCKTVQGLMDQLSRWSTSFGQVIGVSQPEESEAFAAFIQVSTKELPALCEDFTNVVKEKLLPELSRLVDSSLAPQRLVEAMSTLEPLHLGLLNLNVAKSRPPPQLLEASQSYVALRAQLASELPAYLTLLDKGLVACFKQFNTWQMDFYLRVRDRWLTLWNSLKVEGEMNAGAAETVRVWWSRWADIEGQTLGLNIVRQPEKRVQAPELTRQKSRLRMKFFDDDSSETSSTVVVSSSILTLDPNFAYEPLSSPSTLSLQTPVSAKARSVRSLDVGRKLERHNSDESLRSKKSGKSAKSMGHQPSHSVTVVDPDVIGYGYGDALNSLNTTPQKLRTKNRPVPAPLPLKKSHSHGRLLDEAADTRRKSPLRRRHGCRGRPVRKPSFKRRLTETLLPSSTSVVRHHRSPSAPGHPSPSFLQTTTPPHSTPSSSRHRSKGPSVGSARIPCLYTCRVVHPCEPPPGVSYRDLPFFTLHIGDCYDVLQEAGHPALHEDLPLYVDDGEDCLLLVRKRTEDIGWALASFMLPAD
ncbi:uncharacterized protein B0H18DRAFT_910622 [Fomitopsis serialis]|uniref:uncharacterized protein n=1 Tax=Fomitopsis serialis TaxID=139415 RepID=UPI002007B29A|nr:uncharacterized protein B0H18DRAFT_910622 [Neoantrodia serialis]KAH9922107.1 hypothetical protein B0H18DRAFT_910622 [Neoantrodia serialis]